MRMDNFKCMQQKKVSFKTNLNYTSKLNKKKLIWKLKKN